MDTQTKIETVINQFDLLKVHTVMVDLNWEWSICKGVPSPNILAERARELLSEACHQYEKSDDNWAQISSGGFCAQHDDTGLSLSFTLESADVDLSDENCEHVWMFGQNTVLGEVRMCKKCRDVEQVS